MEHTKVLLLSQICTVLDVFKHGADISTFHAYRWILALGSLLFSLPAAGFEQL